MNQEHTTPAQEVFIVLFDAAHRTKNVSFTLAEVAPDSSERVADIEEQLELHPWDAWQELPNTHENRQALAELLRAMDTAAQPGASEK
jgi:hypothetical protein